MKNIKMLIMFLVLLLATTSCIYDDYGYNTSYRRYPSSRPPYRPPYGSPPARPPKPTRPPRPSRPSRPHGNNNHGRPPHR